MDLWDVVRIMVRRWYVSLPMVALTLAAVVWTGVAVSPNHTAEAQVMVLPPSTVAGVDPEGEGEERTVNPWTTDSLAGAIVTALRNRNLERQVEEEGLHGEWEVGLDIQFLSVVNIEVTSPTEHEAQAVIERLLQAVAHEVESQQAPYDITDGEKVTTVVLGSGENVDIVRGNQVRALVVVLGAGLIATMGLTIGVDAWKRRRQAARRPVPAPARGPAAEAAPTSGAPAYPTGNGQPVPARPGVAVGGGPAPEGAQQPGIKVSYRSPADRPVMESAPPEGRTPQQPDDATVVLPLSGAGYRSSSRSSRGYPQQPPSDGPEAPGNHQR